MKNPYAESAAATSAGAKFYAMNCGSCHGPMGKGTGNAPPLTTATVQSAKDGEIFWYITKGDTANGMPAWAVLSENKRWQIISFVKTLKFGASAPGHR